MEHKESEGGGRRRDSQPWEDGWKRMTNTSPSCCLQAPPPDLITGRTGRGVEGVDDCSWCDVDRDLHSLAATGNLRGGCQLYSAQGRLQSLVRKGEGE